MIYILTLAEPEEDFYWLAFDSIEKGREFLKKIPGYHATPTADGKDMEREWINAHDWPDYAEVEFEGNRVPLSRHMLQGEGEIEIYFFEMVDMSRYGQGLIPGSTRIDAYSIPNEEVGAYIEKRENNYRRAAQILQQKGLEIDRAYRGSQDGEAILYRHKGWTEWHFLGHMDPTFVRLSQPGEQTVDEWIETSLAE